MPRRSRPQAGRMSRKTVARILPSELLRDLDAIQKEYFEGRAEVEHLRTALRVEEAKRLAAERQRDADAAGEPPVDLLVPGYCWSQ